jgi:tetratricopeptide (TPR) repeat protein
VTASAPAKSLALVTCLYDLVKRRSAQQHRTVDGLLANADFVLGLDLELVIFTDPELESELRRRRAGRPTKIVAVPFEKLLRSDRSVDALRGQLPFNANPNKDTPVYVQFTWAKFAMLEASLEITNKTHVGWIDLGITHIAIPPPDGVNIFADPSDRPKIHVLCTFDETDVSAPDYWHLIRGHVAGGLFLGARGLMRDLVNDFWRACDKARSLGLSPLEEALLSYVVGQRRFGFAYSFGDYEDILRNHDQARGGDRHCQWIVNDALARGRCPTMVEIASPGDAPSSDANLASSRPLLGLVMIVKNEARRISEVLTSYRPYIDAWTILDTGSTDGTQDMIRGELAGIPGTLYEEPFVNFATSRNRALELHGLATVFSIMPNGDVLEGGPALRSFLEAHRQDHAGAYRVRIAPGHYYHPLVMRTGAGWHYRWRTHECAMGPNQGPQIPAVTVHRDRGTRTDAEWRSRWERDVVLLNQDRVDDPNDPRPYFYLGQTHECLGQHALALPFFERRAEMGGYFDEVFEAKFRIGKMKASLGRPWAEIQQAYLEAYAHDPRRAEPLYAISEYWYDKQQHHISRIFATAAAELPKAPTDLFLDEEIYRWKAADRAAISSFYSGHKDEGRFYAEEAVSRRPDDERLRANRAFFAQSMKELFGAEDRAIEFVPEPGWNASNPSICFALDQIRCVVRTVNYQIVNGRYVTPDGDGVIRTRNFLLELDRDLKTTRSVEMADKASVPRTNYPIHGFEDARLFAWKDKWWASATVCDFTEDGRREIAMLDIAKDGAVVHAEALRGVWSAHVQKNWMPLVDGDVAKFIYAVSPSTIFKLIDGTEPDRRHAIECSSMTLGHGRLRGGSQAVRMDEGWIFIVHDVAFPGSGRLYLHRFVFMNEQLQPISMSDPFYFERLGIEFCAGLALIDDKLVASYAVNDGAARLGIFDLKAVRQSLRKDFVI